jgi:hypothetical protein
LLNSCHYFHRARRCILQELDEPIFLRFYSPEWESGENFSNVLVVTLADYFADLSTWLPSEYFTVRFPCLSMTCSIVCTNQLLPNVAVAQ